MLQKVTWDELVELRWRKRSSKRQSFVIDLAVLEQEDEYDIGIERLIGFFNMVSKIVSYIHVTQLLCIDRLVSGWHLKLCVRINWKYVSKR
jgi:hypothetical protein